MNGFEEFLATVGRKLSEEQLQVVYSNVATVVSAGAGSGKTTVLSYRFLRLVMEKKAKVDEILTLTFTKKAAAEMYERIFSLLSIAAESAPDVREEIQGLANAYISTLDSFSNEIARTDSARYGISRDFEVLSEDDEDKLVESIVLSLYENHKDKMLSLSRLYNPDTVSSDLFLPLSREINILTDFDAESMRNIYLSFLSRIEKKFTEYANSVLNEIEALKSPDMDDSFLFSKGEQSISYIRTLLSSGESCNLSQFNLTQLRAKKFASIRDVIKEKWRPALPLLNSLRCNKDSDFSYMEVFSLFVSSLNTEKRLRGRLTFSDISAVALTILKENPTVRSYYKRKFKYIMIDEFQDNSSDQKDLLYILSEKCDVNGLGVPDKRELDNTKLFFVGDDKQSIYAFRKADVSVFNSLKNEIVSIGGKYLSMRTNYRSETRLIEHFNTIFPSIMSKEVLGEYASAVEDFFSSEAGRDLFLYEATFDSILAGNGNINVHPQVIYAKSENMVASDAEDGDDAEQDLLKDAENEAEYIASLIDQIVSDESFSVPTSSGSRKATYDDIAVLYRTGKSQMPLEKVFRREGLPYTVISSNSITLEALAFDVEAYISLLLYPMDKRSYIAVLRSPFVRLSDHALLSISSSFSDYELLGEPFTHISKSFSALDEMKMRQAREFYLDLKKDIGRLSAEKILDRLYYEGGYSSYIESKMSLSSYKEHYEYLWEIAAGKENVFDFLSYLKNRMDSPSKLDVELLRINMGGVKLMNIHKSKGLEFPIVILAGTNSRPHSPNLSMLLHSSMPDFIALDTSMERGIKKLFNEFTSHRERAEAKRLLYVALTRAETHLVVVASGDKIRNGTLASLYDEAVSDDSSIKRVYFKTLSEAEIESKWEHPNSFDAFYEKETIVRGDYKEIKAGVKSLSHENDENYLISEKGQPLCSFAGAVEDILDKKKLYSEFGTLLHNDLDAFFKKVSNPDYINSSLSVKELDALNKERKRIIGEFISSSFYKKNVEGKRASSEVRFYMPYDDMIAEGSIDLIVFADDYNLIIDYKSDREMVPDYHKGQIVSYLKAAESLYEKKCYGVLLYLRSMETGPFWDSSGNIIEL